MTASAAPTLRPFFARSLGLHFALTAALIGWSWWNNRQRERFGDPNAGGFGSVTVSTAKLPIPVREGRTNPVANDTKSELPTPPKQEPRQRERAIEDPDAVAIKTKRQKRRLEDIAARTQRYRPPEVDRENQLYSNAGQRAVSPMFGVQGAGGVGTGTTSALGTRFGWYEALLRQRVGEKWRTNEVDSRIRTLPVAIVTFTILRDGNVRSVRLAQSSGNYALDISAQRAIQEAAPFPALPPQFERDSASIEFWFELKR